MVPPSFAGGEAATEPIDSNNLLTNHRTPMHRCDDGSYSNRTLFAPTTAPVSRHRYCRKHRLATAATSLPIPPPNRLPAPLRRLLQARPQRFRGTHLAATIPPSKAFRLAAIGAIGSGRSRKRIFGRPHSPVPATDPTLGIFLARGILSGRACSSIHCGNASDEPDTPRQHQRRSAELWS